MTTRHPRRRWRQLLAGAASAFNIAGAHPQRPSAQEALRADRERLAADLAKAARALGHDVDHQR